MEGVNYVQVVPLTWDERFKMYMKRPKKELAMMLAERDKYTSPDACKECVSDKLLASNIINASGVATYATYSSARTIDSND